MASFSLIIATIVDKAKDNEDSVFNVEGITWPRHHGASAGGNESQQENSRKNLPISGDASFINSNNSRWIGEPTLILIVCM